MVSTAPIAGRCHVATCSTDCSGERQTSFLQDVDSLHGDRDALLKIKLFTDIDDLEQHCPRYGIFGHQQELYRSLSAEPSDRLVPRLHSNASTKNAAAAPVSRKDTYIKRE